MRVSLTGTGSVRDTDLRAGGPSDRALGCGQDLAASCRLGV